MRVVDPNERPQDRPEWNHPRTVTKAAVDGSERELLVALRYRIATTIDDATCPPRELAALTRRLHEIVRDIKTIDLAARDGDGADDSPDVAFDRQAL